MGGKNTNCCLGIDLSLMMCDPCFSSLRFKAPTRNMRSLIMAWTKECTRKARTARRRLNKWKQKKSMCILWEINHSHLSFGIFHIAQSRFNCRSYLSWWCCSIWYSWSLSSEFSSASGFLNITLPILPINVLDSLRWIFLFFSTSKVLEALPQPYIPPLSSCAS